MLTNFISASGLSREQIAGKLSISRSYLSQLESGIKQPSLDLAVRIERLTCGYVLATSWVPDPTAIEETPPREDDAA